jgi:hypothetical protein
MLNILWAITNCIISISSPNIISSPTPKVPKKSICSPTLSHPKSPKNIHYHNFQGYFNSDSEEEGDSEDLSDDELAALDKDEQEYKKDENSKKRKKTGKKQGGKDAKKPKLEMEMEMEYEGQKEYA